MIISGIAAAISGALFAGSALATSLIGGALTFGLQLGMKYLNRPKKQKYAAVQGEVQFGADVPVGTLFGTGLVAGHRWFYAKWGSGNKVNADVFGLANGWCDGLEPYVYFYGEKHNLVERDPIGGEAAHYGIEGFGNRVSIRFYDGRPGQAADMKLVNDTANLGKTWKATSVAAGMAYVVVERTFNADLFDKGRPEFEWVLRGLRLYDPRKDSTVAGGSGPHRSDNPATWQHSLNPAVQRLNYQIGLRGMISGRTMVGEGKSIGQLDLGTYFAAMNVCDSLRNGKPTYQSSIWVDGEMDHTEILKEFDDAMAGYALNRRGLSGVIPGAPQIPVLEITADDIPVDRAKDVQLRKSAFDLYNYISGQFTSIESMWKPESLTPVYVNADIAADGRRRQTANDFLQVTDPDIAQYLLNIRYRQNRKGGTATVPVSRRVGLAVQEGEWVTFRGKTWLVTEWQVDEQFRFTLKLAETGADIYDDGDIEPGPIVNPPTQPINPSLLSTVQNFSVFAGMITSEVGHDVPCLEFTWTPPEDPTIVAVRIFYRQAESADDLLVTCTEPESGKFITTDGIVSGTVYNARATITTVPDRLKTFTPWAVTPDPTGNFSVYLPGMIEEIEDLLEDLSEFIGAELDQLEDQLEEEHNERIEGAFDTSSRLRAILSEIASVRDYAAEQDYSNYLDRQELRTTLTAQIGDVYAEFDDRITVAVGATNAIAERVTTLEVGAGELGALILSVDTARIDGDEALAQQISLLSAGTDNQFDPFRFWGFTASAEGWTGNGAPTVADGFLRPADTSTDPYIQSPEGMLVDADDYRQVRARVRRYGSPVWTGHCWWRRATDGTWDAGRRETVAEPVFDANEIGLLTWNMAWTGSIDQIRIDLSAAQTVTDYFTIDWISIGSPSPGASRAELIAERQARIAGDQALAQDIVGLVSELNDATGTITGISQAVSGIETRVDAVEDGLTAQGVINNNLQTEIAGKASVESVEQLEGEIEAIGAGGIVSQGAAITAIRNSLLPIASEGVDQDFANFLAGMGGRAATADASEVLNTRIEQTNESLSVVASAVTKVQAALPGLASASALSALSTTVNEIDGQVSAQAEAISDINVSLGGSSAGVRVRMSAQATPAGYAARYGIEARTGTADAFRAASLFIDVPASTGSPSRVVIRADQFVVTNGSGSGAVLENPLIFSGGELILNVANIGTVNAGRLLAPNGKVDFNLNAGTLEFYS